MDVRAASPVHTAPRRQRNKKVKTCFECRRLKRKCTKTYPCLHCQQTSRECVYPSVGIGTTSTSRTSSTTPLVFERNKTSTSSVNDQSGSNASLTDKDSRLAEACLRIGKLTITDHVGGVRRLDLPHTLDRILQQRAVDLNQPYQSSAPLIAWFKPQAQLPWSELLSADWAKLDTLTISAEQHQKLFDQYFKAVHPVCHVLLLQDSNQISSSNVLWSTIYYAAAASMSLLESQASFGMTQQILAARLKRMAENELCKAGVFRCQDLEIFQALAIYLTPQFLGEVSRSHAIFLDAVIRNFQIARHDQERNSDCDVKIQAKRHLWQHLLFLNNRAIETVGPEHMMPEDSEAMMPDIAGDDSLPALVRYECYKVHRMIFRERGKIKSGRQTLLSLMTLLDFEKMRIRETYLTLLDNRLPLHCFTSVIGKLLLARLDCMAIRSYDWVGSDVDSSASMRQRAIEAGIDIIESAVLLETDPRLAPWAWYSAAFQQYHSVLSLVMELYQEPEMDQRDRILALADHVFGSSHGASAEQRTGTILKAVRDNLRSFISSADVSGDIGHNQGQVWNRIDASNSTIPNVSNDFFPNEQSLDSVNFPNPASSFFSSGLWWLWPGDEET